MQLRKSLRHTLTAIVCFCSVTAFGASKCGVISSQGQKRSIKVIVIDKENMQIDENSGTLAARIQVTSGRLMSMEVINTKESLKSAVPANSIAENGAGDLFVADLKSGSSIELKCKMDY